jgi:hypothetical protein
MALVALVGRVEGAACWLARSATRAAVVASLAGLILWWSAAGDRLTSWWQGTAASLLVLGLCLAPAAWLVNVRFALLEVVDLPDTVRGVATRRREAPRRPKGGLLGAVRTLRGLLRDYGDVTGAWGAVAQLVLPSFWLLTALAFLAVPVLLVLAVIAGLVAAAA